MALYEVSETVVIKRQNLAGAVQAVPVAGAAVSIFSTAGRLEPIFSSHKRGHLTNPFRTARDGRIHFWVEGPDDEAKDIFIRVEGAGVIGDTTRLTLVPGTTTPLEAFLST